jgi:hypothetical protein
LPNQKTKSNCSLAPADYSSNPAPGWGLSRTKSVASGVNLVLEPMSVKKNFFEFKGSMTDVRNGIECSPGRPFGISGSSGNLNKSLSNGLNESGTEFLGLKYLDGTYGRDTNCSRAIRATSLGRNASRNVL